jgi:hypothetical protein
MLSSLSNPRRPPRWWLWLALLGLTQVVDVLSTRVDILRGAMEANVVAANVLQLRGYVGLLIVKLALVAAMGGAVALVHAYSREHPGPRARVAERVVWHGLQLCVVVLALTGLHNVLVLASLQGWSTPPLLTALPLFGS